MLPTARFRPRHRRRLWQKSGRIVERRAVSMTSARNQFAAFVNRNGRFGRDMTGMPREGELFESFSCLFVLRHVRMISL